MSFDVERLYELMPAVYRERDERLRARLGLDDKQHGPLKALLAVIAGQLGVLEEDLAQLYDDQFVETCAEWVLPYIGDLVGNAPLHDIGRPLRADVAKTIGYRRRKGTLRQLEEMARDVTGWSCRAVEFFRLLEWNQNLNHLRPDTLGCANVRDINTMDLVDTAFEDTAHTVDVRPIGQAEGWHSIKNIGFFLWRLRSFPIGDVSARMVEFNDGGKHCCGWTFSPLGNPAPLFHNPYLVGETTGEVGEACVPDSIRPLALHLDLPRSEPSGSGHSVTEDGRYWGRDFRIIVDGVAAAEVVCRNLDKWERPSADGVVWVDVKRGRMTFAGVPKEVTVSYYYGFSADIGGGQYDRTETLANSEERTEICVAKKPPSGGFSTLEGALDHWKSLGRQPCVIVVQDNGVYEPVGSLSVDLPENGALTIEADSNHRPCLMLSADLTVAAPGDRSALTINGLLVDGGGIVVDRTQSKPGTSFSLNLDHCTLVPGRTLTPTDGQPATPVAPSLQVKGLGASVTVRRSIIGPLRADIDSAFVVEDSIVDAPDGPGGRVAAISGLTPDSLGPRLTMKRCTVLGDVRLSELALASDVVFAGVVTTYRLQSGCVRFSYVPAGSQTPRRYRCQPSLAEEQTLAQVMEAVARGERVPLTAQDREAIKDAVRNRLAPVFTSVRYGHPAYCQLNHRSPGEIRTGAEDGSEMGVFCSLRNPQREANLRIRLQEYLPVGLTPGLIYVT